MIDPPNRVTVRPMQQARASRYLYPAQHQLQPGPYPLQPGSKQTGPVPTSKRLNVAVVGATGMVGNEMLRVLSQRAFPTERVVALASERSKGMTVPYNGSSLKVEELSESAFKGIDVALFAAGGDIALMYGPIAAESV